MTCNFTRRFALLLLMGAVGLLGACTSLDKALFFAEDKLLGANGPAVNGIKMRTVGDGFELRSAGVVRGHPGRSDEPEWVTVGQLEMAGMTTMALAASGAERNRIDTFLDLNPGDCLSPRRQLAQDLTLAAPLLQNLTEGSALPRVHLRLTDSGEGMKYYELSRGASIRNLDLYLGQPLPPWQNCASIQFWSMQMVQIVVHELVHIHIFQVFGDVNRIPNEIAAYGSGLCVQLRLMGELPPRQTYGPDGTNSDSTGDVLEWFNTGRMSASMAGNFLSDRLRRLAMGDRALASGDIPALEGFCKRLTTKMIDVRDAADMAYVIHR